ncbi:type II secretion system protein [bacterium]|nr:type II secretion system protein [bacterium]
MTNLYKQKSSTPPYYLNKCYTELVSVNHSPTILPVQCTKKAFTLAEVLITLVIIGVIAALTVPTLINKTNNQETVSKLKKTYSTLSQTTNLIIAEEGLPKNNWATTNKNVYDMYKKYLNNAKECGYSSNCFSQELRGLYSQSVYSSKSINSDTSMLVLADGTQILFGSADSTCQVNGAGNGTQNGCARVWVDLNGMKKPNTFGKDVFEFVLKENGLYPAGCDVNACNNNNSSGFGCACKVLREGAINY